MYASLTPPFAGYHLRRDQPTTCMRCGAPLLLFASLRQVMCRDGHEVWEFTPDGWASRWPHACHGVVASVELGAAACVRIRELRKDTRIQLSVLKSNQREAASTLKLVPPAPGGSMWDDLKHTVDFVLVDARLTASAAVNRFRHPWGR